MQAINYDDDSAFGQNENLSSTTHTLLIADKWINVIQNVRVSTTLITTAPHRRISYVLLSILLLACALLLSSHRHKYEVPTVSSESSFSHVNVFAVEYVCSSQGAGSQLQKIKLTPRERTIHTFTADVAYAWTNDLLFGIPSCFTHSNEEKWNCREWSRGSDDDTFRLLSSE